MRETAFKLYLFFLVSFFLHLTSRIPVLGVMRFDLLLVLLIFSMIFIGHKERGQPLIDPGGTAKRLKMLIIYMVITLPLVKWPGSVLNTGIPAFIKAVIFFYFTVALVTSEQKLRLVVYVLLACQVFRVLEPLYLNITQGYWGDRTYLGGGEFAARLSGAPTDIINPNELGYVILVSIILIYYLLLVRGAFVIRIFALALIGVCAYALILTASRSAFLALGLAVLMVFWSSKRKFIFIIIATVGVGVAYSNLTDFQKDRYLSIFSSETKGSATAQGRVHGLEQNLEVALQRPIAGHGLGTSKEASYHYIGGRAMLSHNLYLEVAIELGFIGLLVYILFLKSIITNVNVMKRKLLTRSSNNSFTLVFTQALYVWAVVTLFFSFAQYGLSIYVIYFIAGLALVLQNGFSDDVSIIKTNEPRITKRR